MIVIYHEPTLEFPEEQDLGTVMQDWVDDNLAWEWPLNG